MRFKVGEGGVSRSVKGIRNPFEQLTQFGSDSVTHLDSAVMVGALAQAFDDPVVGLEVIHLEDLIPSVVAEPRADMIAAGAGGEVHGDLHAFDRVATYALVSRGAPPPPSFPFQS
jgi:hypothetical protein